MNRILILATVGLMVLGGCSEKEQPESGAMVEEITIEEPAGDEAAEDAGQSAEMAEDAADAAQESAGSDMGQ
jgi:hypothetical protein